MSPALAWTDQMTALFSRAGYARVEPPVLQPAEVFVDLSGEDIRRRMFLTQDADGREFCLRPEFTIPVCRAHLEAGGERAKYSYLGPVFRLRTGEPGEFVQAGIESIGRDDIAAADAEILALALEGLSVLASAGAPPKIRLGDMGLLEALIEAIGIAPAAKRQAVRAIVSGRGLSEPDADPSGRLDEHAGLLAAIEGQAPQAAKAFVQDILAIAGISSVGGRSAGEIAERFLARAANRSGLSAEARATLRRYLTITGEPGEAAAQVRTLARETGLAIAPAIELFEERTRLMAAKGLEVGTFVFEASFARSLDYYTGFIFELSDPARAGGKPLVGGGRYDRLLEHLGAQDPVPAVGCAFWLDRIGAEPSL